MKRKSLVFLTVAAAALVFVSAAWALRFTDESYFAPAGAVGSPYSFTFTGAGGCGPALPYQFSLIGGSLPPGLTLASSGTVSGTPSSAGGWSFWVNLSDQNPPSASWCVPSEAQREFTITINGAGGGSPSPGPSPAPAPVPTPTPTPTPIPTPAPTPALSITAPTTQLAEVAVPLTIGLNATGGTAPYRWELAQGSLPTHVGFIGDQGNGSTAMIKGVPATSGSFPLTFRVTDVLGRSTLHTITLSVADKLRLAAKLPRVARVATLYRAHGLAEGGYGKRAWSIARGVLPAGLQLDSKTGFITGRPARRGHYVFYLTAKDELGASRSLKISIVVRP
jgi:large repetitive protein